MSNEQGVTLKIQQQGRKPATQSNGTDWLSFWCCLRTSTNAGNYLVHITSSSVHHNWWWSSLFLFRNQHLRPSWTPETQGWVLVSNSIYLKKKWTGSFASLSLLYPSRWTFLGFNLRVVSAHFWRPWFLYWRMDSSKSVKKRAWCTDCKYALKSCIRQLDKKLWAF